MTASLIIKNLYIGDQEDAKTFKGAIIFVGEELPRGEPAGAIWIPILKKTGGKKFHASITQLNLVADVIAEHLQLGVDVLVHCYAGVERSPLTVAWFLSSHERFGNILTAYNHIQLCRPSATVCIDWLPREFVRKLYM